MLKLTGYEIYKLSKEQNLNDKEFKDLLLKEGILIKNTALGGLNSNPLNIMQKVRAKFKCYSVEEFAGGSKTAKLSAVYSANGENAQFAHATPSGTLSISIDSQTEAVEFFKAGEEYYLDFSPVPKAVAE